ncbi:unnamed protein product [Vitrella brassicaformis CCMP3155]|uniref:TLDc domain-containing protein n=1 Tax=Vitrella brassicaformis (strain CCMP3155) TaxID=1169540 RepID=A0A0G4G5A8_VITBC|nr:unnamed protein product [Vitrella brassicaformis CCMP3155]|eukprot:CEM23414.1 unnamed protein product [Vitrella brassicaformis CCMP3155]
MSLGFRNYSVSFFFVTSRCIYVLRRRLPVNGAVGPKSLGRRRHWDQRVAAEEITSTVQLGELLAEEALEVYQQALGVLKGDSYVDTSGLLAEATLSMAYKYQLGVEAVHSALRIGRQALRRIQDNAANSNKARCGCLGLIRGLLRAAANESEFRVGRCVDGGESSLASQLVVGMYKELDDRTLRHINTNKDHVALVQRVLTTYIDFEISVWQSVYERVKTNPNPDPQGDYGQWIEATTALCRHLQAKHFGDQEDEDDGEEALDRTAELYRDLGDTDLPIVEGTDALLDCRPRAVLLEELLKTGPPALAATLFEIVLRRVREGVVESVESDGDVSEQTRMRQRAIAKELGVCVSSCGHVSGPLGGLMDDDDDQEDPDTRLRGRMLEMAFEHLTPLINDEGRPEALRREVLEACVPAALNLSVHNGEWHRDHQNAALARGAVGQMMDLAADACDATVAKEEPGAPEMTLLSLIALHALRELEAAAVFHIVGPLVAQQLGSEDPSAVKAIHIEMASAYLTSAEYFDSNDQAACRDHWPAVEDQHPVVTPIEIWRLLRAMVDELVGGGKKVPNDHALKSLHQVVAVLVPHLARDGHCPEQTHILLHLWDVLWRVFLCKCHLAWIADSTLTKDLCAALKQDNIDGPVYRSWRYLVRGIHRRGRELALHQRQAEQDDGHNSSGQASSGHPSDGACPPPAAAAAAAAGLPGAAAAVAELPAAAAAAGGGGSPSQLTPPLEQPAVVAFLRESGQVICQCWTNCVEQAKLALEIGEEDVEDLSEVQQAAGDKVAQTAKACEEFMQMFGPMRLGGPEGEDSEEAATLSDELRAGLQESSFSLFDATSECAVHHPLKAASLHAMALALKAGGKHTADAIFAPDGPGERLLLSIKLALTHLSDDGEDGQGDGEANGEEAEHDAAEGEEGDGDEQMDDVDKGRKRYRDVDQGEEEGDEGPQAKRVYGGFFFDDGGFPDGLGLPQMFDEGEREEPMDPTDVQQQPETDLRALLAAAHALGALADVAPVQLRDAHLNYPDAFEEHNVNTILAKLDKWVEILRNGNKHRGDYVNELVYTVLTTQFVLTEQFWHDKAVFTDVGKVRERFSFWLTYIMPAADGSSTQADKPWRINVGGFTMDFPRQVLLRDGLKDTRLAVLLHRFDESLLKDTDGIPFIDADPHYFIWLDVKLGFLKAGWIDDITLFDDCPVKAFYHDLCFAKTTLSITPQNDQGSEAFQGFMAVMGGFIKSSAARGTGGYEVLSAVVHGTTISTTDATLAGLDTFGRRFTKFAAPVTDASVPTATFEKVVDFVRRRRLAPDAVTPLPIADDWPQLLSAFEMYDLMECVYLTMIGKSHSRIRCLFRSSQHGWSHEALLDRVAGGEGGLLFVIEPECGPASPSWTRLFSRAAPLLPALRALLMGFLSRVWGVPPALCQSSNTCDESELRRHIFACLIDGPLIAPSDPTAEATTGRPVTFYSISGAFKDEEGIVNITMPHDWQRVDVAGTQGAVEGTNGVGGNVAIGGGRLWLGQGGNGRPAGDLRSCDQWVKRDELPAGKTYQGSYSTNGWATLAGSHLFTAQRLEVYEVSTTRPADPILSAAQLQELINMTGNANATPKLLYKGPRDGWKYPTMLAKVGTATNLLLVTKDTGDHVIAAHINGQLKQPTDAAAVEKTKCPVAFYSVCGAFSEADGITHIAVPDGQQYVDVAGPQGAVKGTKGYGGNVAIGGGRLWLGSGEKEDARPAGDLRSCHQWVKRDELPAGKTYLGSYDTDGWATLAAADTFTCVDMEVYTLQQASTGTSAGSG